MFIITYMIYCGMKIKLMKKSGKRVSNNQMNTELKRCIMISHYVKRYFYENVYKEKLS